MSFCYASMLCGQGEDLVGHFTLSVSNEPEVKSAVVSDKTPEVAQPAARERKGYTCVW